MVRPLHAGFEAGNNISESFERSAISVMQSDLFCYWHGPYSESDVKADGLKLEALDVFSEISRDLATGNE